MSRMRRPGPSEQRASPGRRFPRPRQTKGERVFSWGFFLIVVLFSASAAGVLEPFPKPGEWPCFRRDRSLQARSPARGHITRPRVAWKQFVGQLETTLVIEPSPGDALVPLPNEAGSLSEPHRPELFRAWVPAQLPTTEPAETDADSPNVAYAEGLPGAPGRKKFEFESGFGKPTINGQWQSCVGRCFARSNGAWGLVWETEPIPLLFQALPLLGDFNHDGRPDLAILPMRELVLLDAQTGRIQDRCAFTDTRSYGFFGAYDFDGDGLWEFLVQADFSKHVDVLGFRSGKLQVLWQKPIELDISNPQKVLRVGPQPVADVDGDGRAEVLITLFNDARDSRWRLTAHDALTGQVKAELPDEYLVAALDVDGDHASELLTIRARGAGVPEFGEISVWSLKGGRTRRLWHLPNAAWQTWEPPLPANVKSTATLGRRTVLCRADNGRCRVLVRRKAAERSATVELLEMQWKDEKFEPAITIAGPGLDALAWDEAGRLLVRARHWPERRANVRVRHGRAALGATKRIAGAAGTAAVAWPKGSRVPTIVVQGSGEELVSFTAPVSERPPVQMHRMHGRGQSTAWPETRGPVIADLSGNGQRQVILATAAPSGVGRLAATDLAGREIWHHDFSGIPGGVPIWNIGGVVLWQVGHFTDRRREDVLVTVRRSMMHSEETYLLSGRDGKPLWHRDRQISRRGVGGTPFAIGDLDGDGLDDAASLHPSILYVLKGTTGQDLLARDAAWESVPAQPVYWGLPIAGDFTGQGRTSLFFAGRSMTGLVRADGSLAWWDALDQSSQDWPAFGNFGGDGRLEAIGVGYTDGIRCYDTASGEVKWRLALPAGGTVAGSASADMDGDGADEALFVIGTKLVCLGSHRNGSAGQVRWQLDLPAPTGPPSLAALEVGGPLSVLLVGADGYVYCVQ